jgi:uncharacterized membrane protein (UPF0127 family)
MVSTLKGESRLRRLPRSSCAIRIHHRDLRDESIARPMDDSRGCPRIAWIAPVVFNHSRDTILCHSVEKMEERSGFLRGFLRNGRHEAFLFPVRGRRGIAWMHTFGIGERIDAIFVGNEGTIVEIDRVLKPRRISTMTVGARYVLQLPAGQADRSGSRIGDRISLVPRRRALEIINHVRESREEEAV